MRGNYSWSGSISFSQPCGYHSSPPDVCQFCSKIEHFFQGGSGGAMSHTSRKSSRSRCSQLKLVWEMRFQIEKMCCGREVIASQSLKSSKKWMLGRWRGDVEVMHPQISDYMHTTAWASIITSYSNVTCKEKMKVSTAAVFVHPPSAPPQSAQNVTVGGGVTWMCRSVNSSIQPIQT